MWNSINNTLQSKLDTLHSTHNIKDPEIGLALLELLQTNQLSQGPLKNIPDAEHTLWMLAWWMFVRAPWLQQDQLVLANMSLDLVLNAQRTLHETLEDLATLEQAVADHVDEYPSDEKLNEFMSKLAKFAEIPSANHTLAKDVYQEHVLNALELMRQHKAEIDEVKATIMSQLFDEFGRPENQEHLQGLFSLEQTTSVHTPEVEGDQQEAVEAAQKLYEEGNMGEALDRFNAILITHPDQVDALVGRGVIHATTQHMDKAFRDLDRAIELEPRHVVALINRGLAYYANEQLEDAIKDFSEAIALDDQLVEAWLNRSSAYAQIGQLEQALDDVNKAVQLTPGKARPRVDRAVIHRAMGNASAALEDYNMATDVEPYHADAWAGRGFLLLELGELDAAKQDLDRAIELEPWRAVLYYNRGNVHAGLGQFEDAIKDYDRVLDIDEEDLEARMNRGTAYLKLGQFKEALEDWDRLIRLYPHEPDAYLRRGVVLMMSGELGFAIKDFEQALEVAPREWPMRDVTEEKLQEAQVDFQKESN